MTILSTKKQLDGQPKDYAPIARMDKAEYKDPTTGKDVPRDGGPEPKKEANKAEMKKAQPKPAMKKAIYKDPTTGKDVPRDGGPEPKKEGDLVKNGAAFKKLEHKVEGEGYSEKSAKAIAAAAGRKSMGKEAFQAKAAAGRKK